MTKPQTSEQAVPANNTEATGFKEWAETLAAAVAVGALLAYGVGRTLTDGFYDRLGVDAEEVGRGQPLITIRAGLPLALLVLVVLGIYLIYLATRRPYRLPSFSPTSGKLLWFGLGLVLLVPLAFVGRKMGWDFAERVQRGEGAQSGLYGGFIELARMTADRVCLEPGPDPSVSPGKGPYIYLGTAEGFIVLFDYNDPDRIDEAGERILRIPDGAASVVAFDSSVPKERVMCPPPHK
jgi:hypothetical protein